jgi:hypothetical protein
MGISGSEKLMTMKKIYLLITAFCFILAVQAQRSTHSSSYQTALGVKIWDGGGITFKHFLADNRAMEFIGWFSGDGFRLTGLYEIHGDINGAPGLKWYIGPGAHIGFYDYYKNNNHIDGVYIGIDGVIGLDYKFNGAPINLSLDWQPTFEFGEHLGFGSRGGLGIRYTF